LDKFTKKLEINSQEIKDRWANIRASVSSTFRLSIFSIILENTIPINHHQIIHSIIMDRNVRIQYNISVQEKIHFLIISSTIKNSASAIQSFIKDSDSKR